MSSYRIRPRFKHTSRYSSKEIHQIIESHLDDPSCSCTGSISPGFITLKIPQEDRHYWSPQLTLSIEDQEGGSIIRGLYGPNPRVWSMFMFGYAALGSITFFVGIIGFSNYSLGADSRILWLLPLLIGLALVLYIIAQLGQKTGAQQMFTLHHFYEDVLGEKVRVH